MNSAAHHIGPDTAPDRYRLLSSIGRGGEAVLYRAEIELDGAPETVVVKVLDSKSALGPGQFARLSAKWNEQAELLRFANRPGVVGVREHFEGAPIHAPGGASTVSGRALALVMNHVEGVDLRDWRFERTLTTPAERRAVMGTLAQLADVLDWLHSGRATTSGRVVVHGDLSPGNVMVNVHGQATLVDFGLSKLTADHETAEVWFTPGYAAPEVFDGRRTPATDRYAFGAIAYFLLSGQAPPNTPEQLRHAIRALPQLSSLPPERKERVLAVCATAPEQRPESLAGWLKDVRDAVVSTSSVSAFAAPSAAPSAASASAAASVSAAASATPVAPGTPTPSAPTVTSARPVPPPAVPPPPVLPPPPPAKTPPAAAAPPPVRTPPAPAPSPSPPPVHSVQDAVPPRRDTPGLRPGPLVITPAPARKRRPAVAVLAVALAGALTVIAAQWMSAGGDDENNGAPSVTETVTATETETAAPPAPDPSASESPDESGEPGSVAGADAVSLTGFPQVDGDDMFSVKEAAINSENHSDAFVSDYDCGGYMEFNLGRAWSTLDLVAGIEDNSVEGTARLHITLDGTPLFEEKIELGKPRNRSLSVKNGLRLVISYTATDTETCDAGTVALGTPTLRK
ncbi:serine/threonine protein kinase [Streptomyces sp. NPDC060131]|uniref:serine/threonine protein kinase n=1 Tax=unclassified Streptomyces TaxID=2593676 RepID=UPI00365C0E81